MQDLHGLTAVITGGSSGLGLGMAHGLARAGAKVAIWARDPDRNAAAVAELRSAGAEAVSVACDSGDAADVVRATQETVDRFGAVDCLVANAGIASAAPFLEMDLATWHRVLRTNLDGTFLTCQAVARHMVERGAGGAIVVVSSTIARYGGAGQAAYATSKTGLVGLGRTLAVELARHRIRCNILIPGWTETAMNTSLREDQRFVSAVTARTPVRRWATPEEFHDVAAFLADPRLTFHTGNEVVVDGGYTVF
ncbi:SDR family NAD(P)-dependent oxidoreductase [Klenkia brasiliensis]|uniref:NAD(P)-dependent dehydrogenase, short-chain alcohol dehydrogenase family n=1 Tax=Klenkia brasiliensis TaxID=333142 RepID=A0A1G7S6M3_9ACTN|nr:SDR family NAD(P)-dependent oxidoreductase [Klenkia brasiliensis]SDG18602.1 NAD(P)-dependent dehydrogenase, short-chain alcohol dehydrogenase family [Klenkia brasiliensis]